MELSSFETFAQPLMGNRGELEEKEMKVERTYSEFISQVG